MNLDKSVGIEIFLVVEDEISHSEIEIYDNYVDTLEYLSVLEPEINYSTKVYNGVLVSAKILPSDVYGKKCYIVVLTVVYNKSRPQLEGYIFESDCDGQIEILAEEVEELVKSKGTINFTVDIDNIFILYGHELETCLSINQDSMDDEVIDTCEKIAKEVKEIELLLPEVIKA